MPGSRSTIEYGYVDFTGQTSKSVTLTQFTYGRGELLTTIVELPNTYNSGSASPNNNVNDVPANYFGTVQVSGQFVSDQTFVIYTTAPFYGRVKWTVTSN